jgi:hypothetical protein
MRAKTNFIFKINDFIFVFLLICLYWSALAPTPAQLQLGAKEAINSMEMPFLPFSAQSEQTPISNRV